MSCENMAEEYIQKYPSMQKWFSWKQPPYKESTKKLYIGYMKRLFCVLSNKTPDELAKIKTLEEADKVRGVIAKGMRHRFHLGTTSIEYRVHALNQFYRANGVPVEDPYGGIEESDSNLFKNIMRLRKWHPNELNERRHSASI